MRVTKWVDLGAEVEIEIGADDIRCALAEAFANVTQDRLGEERPNKHDVLRALNGIAGFLKALTDEQIGLMSASQRSVIAQFLGGQAKRYRREAI